jgi:hypothetical protein
MEISSPKTNEVKLEPGHKMWNEANNAIKLSLNGMYSEPLGGFVMIIHDNPPRTWGDMNRLEPGSRFLQPSFEDAERVDEVVAEVGGDFEEINRRLSGFRIERPLFLDKAFIDKTEDGPFLVAIGKSMTEKNEVDALKETVINTDELLSKLGIDVSTNGQVILISPQLPFSHSEQIPSSGIIKVGVQGIDNLDNPDVKHVVAHEYAHSKIQEFLLKEFGLPINMLSESSGVYHLMEYLNEGVAEYAGLTAAALSPKAETAKRWESMYPQAREDISRGELKALYENEKIANWLEESELGGVEASIHTRILPAAFVEYLSEKNLSVRQLIALQVERDKQLKEVERMPSTLVQPFELLASLTGSDKVLETKQFVGWLLDIN